jgi:hypothetical protein
MRDVYAASFYLGAPPAADVSDAVATAAGMALAWMASKYDLAAPSQWQGGELTPGRDRGTWHQDVLRDGKARLWQLDWHRYDVETGLVWQTCCQIGAEERETRFTVRIAIDSADDRLAPARYEVGRPAVIPLLAQSPGIYQDGRRLGPQPALASSGGIPDLIELLLDPVRRLPVVVLTPTGDTGRGLVDPGKLAFRLIGLAHVVQILEREATFGLTKRLGELLSVFNGAIRVYWPGLSLTSSPWDHPLWLRPRIEQIEGSDAGVATRLERQLAGVGVMRVRPDPLEEELRATKDRELLGRVSGLQSELERLLSRGVGPGDDWLAELQSTHDELKGVEAQVITLQREKEDLRRDNDQLRRSFADYSQALDADMRTPEPIDIPEDTTTSTEAFELARKHLSGLVIPDSAAVALRELDAANESQGWARSAWRAFRALNAYVADSGEYSGFWDWCEHSPASLWAASDKKLAMGESETVTKSRELREKRRFEVDPQVDPSGRKEMFSHIKVSEGGGQHIPRIYFLDDTKGLTGKVHIGFFGPHRFVPNKSTN